jgi:23S rRNA (cytosine1962-C5)-methyltransferase
MVLAPPKVSIKKGREWQILRGHPWLFSGAISQVPSKIEPGDIVDLVDVDGRFVARGYYNAISDIAVRILTCNPNEPIDRKFIEDRLRRAIDLRAKALDFECTNVYRLINAEGDFLPGIIADRFADVVVLQSHTAGGDRLLPDLIAALKEELQPKVIILRNDALVRKREGLEQVPSQVMFGEAAFENSTIEVKENDLHFRVDPMSGQKTGFFADQRQKRLAVKGYCQRLPAGAILANLFSYTGAFSVYASVGNPHLKTINVDESGKALELARKNFEINALSLKNHSFVEADVFKWLEEQVRIKQTFDFIILDPPSFAKSQKDKEKALKAYERLNRLALQCCSSEAFLLTCSCSGIIGLDELQTCVRSASGDARRSAQILEVFKGSADHPVNAAALETEYLKVILCRVI